MKKLLLIFGLIQVLSTLHAQIHSDVFLDAVIDMAMVNSEWTGDSILVSSDSLLARKDQISSKKTKFLLRESDVVLRLNSLPIYTWVDEVRYIRPLPRDFNKLFDTGKDEEPISMEDALGVSLAATKALTQEIRRYDVAMIELEKANEDLSRKYRSLERLVTQQRKQIELLRRQMSDLMLRRDR